MLVVLSALRMTALPIWPLPPIVRSSVVFAFRRVRGCDGFCRQDNFYDLAAFRCGRERIGA